MVINSQMAKTQIIFASRTGCNTHQSNKQTIIYPKVINFSSTCLTDTQIRVLGKVLKFTPTPRRSTVEMEKDNHNFTRKLRLIEYFTNENNITFDEEAQPLLKNKGTFHPLEIETKRLILLLIIQTTKILTTQRLYTNLISQKMNGRL